MNLREIDRAVAEKVLGIKTTIEYEYRSNDIGTALVMKPLRNYSTNIADAWEVSLEMNKKGFLFDVMTDTVTGYYADFFTDSGSNFHHKNKADTAPLAICKAALKAVGVEV